MIKLADEGLITRIDETNSTNLALKHLQQSSPLAEGSIISADFQTSGRGQVGNSWFSSKGANLLFSLLLYPKNIKAKHQFIISRIVSLALKRVLDRYMQNITIKWPNDIYWKNKKIAGILIENNLMGQYIDYTIIGVGLNVNEDDFPANLPNPISMRQITGFEIDRDKVLASLQKEFWTLYQSLKQGDTADIEQEYMSHLYRGQGVYWFSDETGTFKASIKTVLPTGHLILSVHDTGETKTYAFKEVSFVAGKE